MPAPLPVDGEVDRSFADTFHLLGRQKWVILAVLLVALSLALLYLNVALRTYTSQLGLTPVSNGPASGGQALGGLASLAGIQLPGNEGQSQLEVFLEGLTSRAAANSLARGRPDLMHRVFDREWDGPHRAWRPPIGIMVSVSKGLKSALGFDDPWRPPDGERLQTLLQRQIVIDRDRDKRITVISIATADPRLGRDLLSSLHGTVDDYMRQKSLLRAEAYVVFLKGELQSVTVEDYRMSLLQTIAQQEKLRMVAHTTLPFAADPFGPPTTLARPTSPSPLITLAIAVVVGLLGGITLAFVRDGRRKSMSAVGSEN